MDRRSRARAGTSRRIGVALGALLSGCAVAILGAGGLNAHSATADQPSPTTTTGWSTTTQIDPALGTAGFSCASSQLCIAVGQAGASVFTGSSWGPITDVDPSPMGAVACAPGTSFCMGSDRAGDGVAFDDGTAQPPQTISAGSGPVTLACPTATACVGIAGNETTYGWNGSGWAETAGPAFEQPVEGLACSSPSFCVALDDIDYSVDVAGTWSAPVALLTRPDSFRALACVPGADTCIAGDVDGDVYVYSGGSWGPAQTLAANVPVNSISCAPDGSCTVDAGSQAYTYTGGSWNTTPVALDLYEIGAGDSDASGEWLSCPTSDFCAALDSGADLLTSTGTGTAWTSGPRLGSGGLMAVSCAPATQFCGAVDAAGRALTSTDGSWSAPQTLDPSGPLTSISCPSASFCAATGAGSEVFTYNGQSWSSGESLGASGAGVVSCTASTFCLAVNLPGDTFTYDGQTWTSGPQADPMADPLIDDVSCVTRSFCEAIGLAGNSYTFNGTAWSAAIATNLLLPEPLSCTGAGFCLAADEDGNTGTFDGSDWTVTHGSFVISALSCVSSSWCLGAFPSDGPNDPTGLDIYTGDADDWAGTAPDGSEYVDGVSCASEDYCVLIDNMGNTAGFFGEPASTTTTSTTTTSTTTTATATTATTPTSAGTTTTIATTTTTGTSPTLTTAPSAPTTTTPPATGATTTAVVTTTPGPSVAISTDQASTPTLLPVTRTTPAPTPSPPAVTPTPPSAAVITAVIRSWLDPLVELSGRAGHLSRIRRVGYYPATFRAPVPGTVRVTWTATERIAHTRRTRTITVADATARTIAPSTAIRIKLTAAGRRLLESPKLTSERVTATATFTYASGNPSNPSHSATSTRTVTLAR